MPPNRKENKQNYFTVEGETEKWYLDWLEITINAEPVALHRVSIKSKVQTHPLKFAKGIPIITSVDITHWFDYESHEPVHTKRFTDTLDQLKQANSLKGKQIKYHLGYSNLTFELWLVLHKENCNGYIEHRDHYFRNINSAFGERFSGLAQYKEEATFKRSLENYLLKM